MACSIINDSIQEIESIYSDFEPLSISPKIYLFDELDSTNTYAKNFLKEAPEKAHGSIIIAKKQSSGRGRLGRNFFSNTEKGLYISFILDTKKISALPMSLITPYISLAVVRSIKQVWNLDLQVKWVNDIFYNRKKIAGILTEGFFSPKGELSHVIIGIGINIFQIETDFPLEVRDLAGSIYEALFEKTKFFTDNSIEKASANNENKTMNFEAFYNSKNLFTAQLIHNVFGILTQDIHKIPERIAEYKSYSNILGKEITVIQGDSTFPAKALDINEKGHLIVEDSFGKISELLSGEVSIRF